MDVMYRDRPERGEPQVVPLVTGVVVAAVAGVFGLCAHGLASAGPAFAPDGPAVLLALTGSALVGATTAAMGRRLPLLPVAGAGLLAGQLVVHLVLAGHHLGHSGGAHPGHLAGPRQTLAVQAAMDSATPQASPFHMSPVMAVAHLAAIAVTVVLLALISGALAWLGSRVVTPVRCTWGRQGAASLRPTGSRIVPTPAHLFSGGGTRAPSA